METFELLRNCFIASQVYFPFKFLFLLSAICLVAASPNNPTTRTIANDSDPDDLCLVERKSTRINLLEHGVQDATDDLRQKFGIEASHSAFRKFCSILKRSCTVDLGLYSSDLETVCEDTNGKLAPRNAHFGCSFRIEGVRLPGDFRFEVLRLPVCLGKTCDEDDLPYLIEGAVNDFVEQLQKQFQFVFNQSPFSDGKCEELSGLDPLRGLEPVVLVSAVLLLAGLYVRSRRLSNAATQREYEEVELQASRTIER